MMLNSIMKFVKHTTLGDPNGGVSQFRSFGETMMLTFQLTAFFVYIFLIDKARFLR